MKRIDRHLLTHRCPEVSTLESRKRLRKLGDNENNKRVIDRKAGELILARRPSKHLDIRDYGPCTICFEWVYLPQIKQHYRRCQNVHATEENAEQLSSRNKPELENQRDLVIHSQVMAGHIDSSKHSKAMQQEVLPSIKDDEIGKLATQDPLILSLGESWLLRNKGNNEKRKHYASQHMRLVARLLLHVREKTSLANLSLWDALVAKNFDHIVAAALMCTCPSQDEEFLASPSNAIKLKYDLVRLIQIKYTSELKTGFNAKDTKRLLTIIKFNWATQVNTHARAELQNRQLTKEKKYPSPQDVALLTHHLQESLKMTTLEVRNFDRLVELLLTRLLLFNKRRSGEIEVIK